MAKCEQRTANSLFFSAYFFLCVSVPLRSYLLVSVCCWLSRRQIALCSICSSPFCLICDDVSSVPICGICGQNFFRLICWGLFSATPCLCIINGAVMNIALQLFYFSSHPFQIGSNWKLWITYPLRQSRATLTRRGEPRPWGARCVSCFTSHQTQYCHSNRGTGTNWACRSIICLMRCEIMTNNVIK